MLDADFNKWIHKKFDRVMKCVISLVIASKNGQQNWNYLQQFDLKEENIGLVVVYILVNDHFGVKLFVTIIELNLLTVSFRSLSIH